MIERSKEWWLRRLEFEPDCLIAAGVPVERDPLRECQMLAALGIERTNDVGELADIFAAIDRVAASAQADRSPEGQDAGGGLIGDESPVPPAAGCAK